MASGISVNQRVLGSSPRGGAKSREQHHTGFRDFFIPINYPVILLRVNKIVNKMAERILLPNGCFMSKPSVNPKNWKTGSVELLNKNWQVQYYFYDPNHPRKRKLVAVKGMNEFNTLSERRAITKGIISDEIYNNEIGFNPILGKFTHVITNTECDLNPNFHFIEAFRSASDKINSSADHQKQIKWAINRIEKAAIKLKIRNLKIIDLKRRNLKQLLDYCDLPDNYYNKYLAYLSSLFRELLDYECCEANLARDIRKKKITVRQREVLTITEMQSILKYLKKNHYNFYRYTMIFFYAAPRSSELMRMRVRDVDLKNREFKVLIKKRRTYKEEIKVILSDALPFWAEITKGANPNDFVFSKDLSPGPDQILPNQITKRWYRLVKKSDKIKDDQGNVLKVTADFYAFKHLFLDCLDEKTAQSMAHHLKSKTTAIYRVNQEKRDREALKNMDIKLKIVS